MSVISSIRHAFQIPQVRTLAIGAAVGTTISLAAVGSAVAYVAGVKTGRSDETSPGAPETGTADARTGATLPSPHPRANPTPTPVPTPEGPQGGGDTTPPEQPDSPAPPPRDKGGDKAGPAQPAPGDIDAPPSVKPGIYILPDADRSRAEVVERATTELERKVSEKWSSDRIDTYLGATGMEPNKETRGAWSAAFASWVFQEQGTPINGGGSASIEKIRETAKTEGTYQNVGDLRAQLAEGAPKTDLVGQLVLLKTPRTDRPANQIGIVVAHDRATGDITTIEGNVNGAVAKREYNIKSPEVNGFVDVVGSDPAYRAPGEIGTPTSGGASPLLLTLGQ